MAGYLLGLCNNTVEMPAFKRGEKTCIKGFIKFSEQTFFLKKLAGYIKSHCRYASFMRYKFALERISKYWRHFSCSRIKWRMVRV